jgi:hypothetical protein
MLTVLTVGAVILNPRVKIGGKDPLWDYHLALLYKLAEGVTLGYGCGCCRGFEKQMQRLIRTGGKWHWARVRRGGHEGVPMEQVG